MKSLLPAFITNLVFLAILLLSAGTFSYWPAYVYVALGLVLPVLMRVVLRGNPELAQERAKPGPGAKDWDKKLLGSGLLLSLVTLVVAGLDAGRFHWSPQLGWPWAAAGLTLNLASTVLFLVALRENRFFSAVVRIQADRGHAVCSTGPYRVVRHPGNAAMILGTLGQPLLLLSAWSLLPSLVAAALMLERTRREDAMLAAELPGYSEYQRATRFRLVPGVW